MRTPLTNYMRLNKYLVCFICVINGKQETITQTTRAINKLNAVFEASKIMTLDKHGLIKALNDRYIETFEILSVAEVIKLK